MNDPDLQEKDQQSPQEPLETIPEPDAPVDEPSVTDTPPEVIEDKGDIADTIDHYAEVSSDFVSAGCK